MTKEAFKGISIEYRNRKTLEIQIKPDGQVRVLAPKNSSREWIKDVIESKRSWIENKRKLVLEKRPLKTKIEDGMKVLESGDWLTLKIGQSGSPYPIYRCEDILYVNIIETWKDNENVIKEMLRDFYTNNTRLRIEHCVNIWIKRLGIQPNRIKIKDQKRRWGSCSSKGNLNFNWRLSMAPDDILEYVVVHELCHFYHMDHSKDFWALVENHLPDYKIKRKWLKDNGQHLFLLDE